MPHPRFVALLAAPVVVIGSPAMAQNPSDAELAQEVIELRKAVAALQSRLNDLEASAAKAADAPVSTAAPQAPVPQAQAPQMTRQASAATPPSQLPPRDTIGDQQTGVARPDTRPPPNDPDLKGYIPIPGTETMVKLGGFAKVNAIYDFRPAGNPRTFVTSSIPVDAGDARNSKLDANATRFSFDVRRPSSLGPLRFYLENDFYGSNGGTAFRLRQAHGQVGNTYAGYGYSAFMDADASPETLDDEGPNGSAFARTTAIRQIWKIGGGATATLSLEDPDSQLTLPATWDGTQPAPDLVGALRWEGKRGHWQASAVARNLGYSDGRRDESAFAYGLNVAGLVTIYGDFLMAGLTYGDGIARYFNDLGGLGYDGVVEPDGKIRPLKAYGGYLAYTHHWSPKWRSNLVGSALVLERDDLLVPTAFRSSGYGALNLIWAVSPNFTVGVEALYGRHELQNGRDADVTRLQASLKYDLVR